MFETLCPKHLMLITCSYHDSQYTKLHFLTQEILEVIFKNYFKGISMRGSAGRGNGKFINYINKQFICFIVIVLHHALKA